MLTKRESEPGTDPFARLRQMSSQLDRLFDEVNWPRWPRALRGDRSGWYPGIDVFERDGHLITRADLPGLKKEDVKVEIAEGQLVISGERQSESEETREGYFRAEREYGRFYRAVPLPETASLDGITATFEDGVLEVHVPLRAKPQPEVRRVEVADAPKAKTAA